MIVWKPKSGPLLTAGRSAHFAWGALICVAAARWGYQALGWACGIAVAVGFGMEVFSFITYRDDPHPFGDVIDFLSWLLGICAGCALVLIH